MSSFVHLNIIFEGNNFMNVYTIVVAPLSTEFGYTKTNSQYGLSFFSSVVFFTTFILTLNSRYSISKFNSINWLNR